MGATPQVPNIAPISQAPTAPSEDITALLGQVAQKATATLPPKIIQGTSIAEPRVAPVSQYQQKNENTQPLNNQATSLKMARTKNAFAEVANTLGKAGQQLQERKQTLLKEDLKTVMTAKQNIANAQIVLQTDPNNKMAQQVLAANKQQLEAILNDPKKQKQLAKAFDVSFTDPNKNKKPEIVAGQQALKEFKAEGPFTSNNPAEHQVSIDAQKVAQYQQQQQQSQTPKADQLLAKDLPNVQVNPEYTQAKGEQDAAQQKLTQYVIPRLIEAESKANIQAVKDGNEAARAQYKAVTDFNRQSAKLQADAGLQDQKAKDAMQLQARKDSAAMARTIANVNARLKVAEMKQMPAEQKTKLQAESLGLIDKDISTVTKNKLDLDKALTDPAVANNPEAKKQIEMMLNYNELHLATLNQFRQQKAVEIYGRVAEGRNDRLGTGSNKQVVGTNLSDEPDEDDDSDDY